MAGRSQACCSGRVRCRLCDLTHGCIARVGDEQKAGLVVRVALSPSIASEPYNRKVKFRAFEYRNLCHLLTPMPESTHAGRRSIDSVKRDSKWHSDGAYRAELRSRQRVLF